MTILQREPHPARAPAVAATRQARPDAATPVAGILALQQAAGNQAVQRLAIQRQPYGPRRDEPPKMPAEIIREQLEERERYITTGLRRLQGGLGDADPAALQAVKAYETLNAATGVLSVEMVDQLAETLQSARPDAERERLLDELRFSVGIRDKLREQSTYADDPSEFARRTYIDEQHRRILRELELLERDASFGSQSNALVLIRSYRTIFLATGTLSSEMIDQIAEAFGPLAAESGTARGFRDLRHAVQERSTAIAGADDPFHWNFHDSPFGKQLEARRKREGG